MLWIEYLIAGHDRHEVLCVRQVNDIVSPSRNHVDGFDLVSGYFKLNGFPGVDVPLLDEPMALYDYKLFPLAVVPVLAFCNTRL